MPRQRWHGRDRPVGALGTRARARPRRGLLAHGPADGQHRRQRDRAGQPVRQPMCDESACAMPCASPARWSAARGPPGATRTAARRAPRYRCRRRRPRQVLRDRPGDAVGERLGVRVAVPRAERLERVRERVHAGRRGGGRRQPDGQLGVEQRREGLDGGVAEVDLAAGLVVGEHAEAVGLRRGAGRGRDREHRQPGRDGRRGSRGSRTSTSLTAPARSPWRRRGRRRRRAPITTSACSPGHGDAGGHAVAGRG